MPTAEAHVPTSRASRYLVQFCRHTSQMGGMRHRPPTRDGSGQLPPTVQHADWSDTTGTVRFSRGQCTLRATADTLTLRVDAADEDTLRRLQDGIARRLETIGRRDQLAVNWQQPDSAPGFLPGEATSATPAPMGNAAARQHRGFGRTLIRAGAAALAIVVRLGRLAAHWRPRRGPAGAPTSS